jgi:SAM-dependent methyltransferase
MKLPTPRQRELYAILPDDSFSRLDEADDALFYAEPRLVSHLDQVALETIQRIIGQLVVEHSPAILDLMASWDSHLPEGLRPASVAGLGLNSTELQQNPALTARVVHDLNREPTLPFDDNAFDVVLNVVSVDYLVHPLEVFREVGRVLRPGGLHLVLFSNRVFRTKAIKIWLEAGESERVWLVEDYFQQMGEQFEPHKVFSSQGKPRPPDDPYAEQGIPSDPIYVVYAIKAGAGADKPVRPEPESELGIPIDLEEVKRRKAEVHKTLCCPYCEQPLQKYEISETPFVEWDNEYVYVCFNNRCTYYTSGWEVMREQGNFGHSYRLMYDDLRDKCMPVPTANAFAQASSMGAPRG